MSKRQVTTFRMHVENGKRIIPQKDVMAMYMNNLMDGEYYIQIKKHYKGRTKPQNDYYWDICTLIAVELGYEKDDIHRYCGDMFLRDNSGIIPKVKSTTSLNTKEMSDYIEQVRRWAQEELNIYCPTPEEYYLLDFQ